MTIENCTVVIPAYNASRTVAGAICSVLTQEGLTPRVVVVDDGSQDETASVAGAFAGTGRVHVVSQENAGPAAARNTGATYAEGEMVGFLDADDILLPGWLRRLAEEVEGGADVACANAIRFGGTSGGATGPLFVDQPAFADPLATILARNILTSAALVRRAIFDRVDGFDPSYRAVADWDLWIRIIANGGVAVFVPDCLWLYRRHASSMSADTLSLKAEEVRLLEATRKRLTGRYGALAERQFRTRAAQLDLLRLAADDARSLSTVSTLVSAGVTLRSPRVLARAGRVLIDQVLRSHRRQ